MEFKLNKVHAMSHVEYAKRFRVWPIDQFTVLRCLPEVFCFVEHRSILLIHGLAINGIKTSAVRATNICKRNLGRKISAY
jgi:hypothetical protein